MESIVKLFLGSIKLKILSGDLALSHPLNWSKRTSTGMSLPLFFGLWIMEEKGTPLEIRLTGRVLLNKFHFFGLGRLNLEKDNESIVNLFSNSLKLKRSSSDLVPSHSLNWSRRTSIGMSSTLFPSCRLQWKKVRLGRFISLGEFSSVTFILFLD